MSPKKKQQSSFKRIRIVSKRAHDLLDTARSRIKTAKKTKSTKGKTSVTGEGSYDQLVVHISIGSVVKAAFAILAIVVFVYLCIQIRDKILLLLLSVLLSVVIDPGVSFLEKWRIPRGFGILIVYVIVLAFVFFLVVSLIPIIAEQIHQMASNLGDVIDAFLADPTLNIKFLSGEINTYINTLLRQVLADVYTGGVLDYLQQFANDLSSAAQGSLIFVVGVAGSVVQFIIKLVMVLVLAFFLQLEKERVLQWARVFFPYRYRRYADGKAEAIHQKLAQWIRGQLMLSLSIGILVFVALTVLRMPYALTLAVLAAFTEFIPVVGPIFAAVPAIFIALAQSGFFPALIVGVVYYGIQWCENNLLVPLIMQRAVGLSPIAVMFAMLVGISFPSTVHPILGVLLAVPSATILSVFLQDLRDWRGMSDD
jgi:predicted PurR-regulated permease PerM